MSEDISRADEVDFVEARIVPDEIVTQDAFLGGGHTRTARSLASTIIEFSEKDAAIGLEGNYGAGKTVVIAITQDLLENDADAKFDYRVFTHDLWSHQSESFRRGYLEELLAWSGSEKQSLLTQPVIEEFRDDIRDRTVETTTENTQSFHWFAYVLLIAAPLLPLIVAWASPIGWNQDASKTYVNLFGTFPSIMSPGFLAQIMMILLYFLFAVAIGRAFFRRPKPKGLSYENEQKKKYFNAAKFSAALAEAAQPFKVEKAQTEKQTQVIREEDPSTLEFQKLFRRIIQAIQNDKKKSKPIRLVLVFDNIDRLPATRIPDVWGEMRSIFAATLPQQLTKDGTVTAIVPFDQNLIDEAFYSARKRLPNEENTHRTTAGRELITKTFAATLRVAPPIGYDNREFFYAKLSYATKGKLSKDEKWTIYRLFYLSTINQPTPPSPRQVISFINRIVVLWNERQGDIPPVSLALYAATADRISDNPSTMFDKKEIGSDLVELTAQPEWDIHMAAMYYNVQVQHVLPILMHREIETTFIAGDEEQITQLSQRKYFDDALLEFSKEYENQFQPSDLSTYASILRALSYIEVDSPSMVQVWRIFTRLDAYSGDQVTVQKDILLSLANRMLHMDADRYTIEVREWVEFVFSQTKTALIWENNLIPSLDETFATLPAERHIALRRSIKEVSAGLSPRDSVEFVVALGKAKNLDASSFNSPTDDFESQLVEVLVKRPEELAHIVKAEPKWLKESTIEELYEKLLPNLDSKLGTAGAEEAFLPIWACYEGTASVLASTTEAREKGLWVLLFWQALEDDNEKLAAKAFLFESLGSSKLNAIQYPNRNVDGIGSVHDAVNFYNERTSTSKLLSKEFVDEVAKLVIDSVRGRAFRELAITAPLSSVYNTIFKKVVENGNHSTPDWDSSLVGYEKIHTALGDDLFGQWLSKVAERRWTPSTEYTTEEQVRLLEDIEKYEISELYHYSESQNKKFRELSEDDWLSILGGSNELLSLLDNRLRSDLFPLKKLAAATRFALLRHIGLALGGDEAWLEGGFYDRLYGALIESSQGELLASLAAEVAKLNSNDSQIRELSESAPTIFWRLPFQKHADDFIRNIVSPLLGTDIELLVEFALKRPDEAPKISSSMSSETGKLLRDDISAAYASADVERRKKLKTFATAINVEIDYAEDTSPEDD